MEGFQGAVEVAFGGVDSALEVVEFRELAGQAARDGGGFAGLSVAGLALGAVAVVDGGGGSIRGG